MKLLYTSLVDVSLPYGPGVNERMFLRDMIDLDGVRLHAVIPSPTRGMPPDLDELSVDLIPTGGSVRRLPGWAIARLLGTIILRSSFRKFRPDLLVARPEAFPLPAYTLARWGKTPYVLKTASDGTYHHFYGKNVARRLSRGINDRMHSLLLAGARSIDVVSEAQRAILAQNHPRCARRVHVVDNGVDLGLFTGRPGSLGREEVGLSEGDLVLGYVGSFPMRRGAREVIDCVATLRHDLPIRGLIVGDSGEADACRAYAAERAVADRVRIYGEADYSLVPDLMALMDIGFSLRQAQEQNASELKVRQYLASGLLVVGSKGSNDFLEGAPYARVVDSNSADEVATAVRVLVDGGPERLRHLKAEARRYAVQHLTMRSRNLRRMALWKDPGAPEQLAASDPSLGGDTNR